MTIKISKIKRGLLLGTIIILGIACKKEEKGGGARTANYVMSLRAQDGAEESADYFLTLENIMEGEISAEGQGIELLGWNYNGHFGDTYFAFGYDLNECIGYKIVDGYLEEQGKFVFERMDIMNPIDDNYFLGIGAPWGGGSYDCQIQVVDIQNISISKNKKHPIYVSYDEEGTQLNAWPTGSYVDGNRLFVSFYPLEGESWETPNTDTAYMSIYSYPELEYIKTIKDARVAPIGYYGASPAIMEDENGDHYTISGGAKSIGFTQATKPSGILRVKAGTEEFDNSYLFDVESSGYRVLSGAYAGNGLAVARVISLEIDDLASAQSQWAAFSEVTPILNVAVLDLYNKTVTVVDEVPLHGGQYQTPYLVENGKVYISVNDGTEAYVYEIDPVSATAKKGARLIGNQFQCLFSAK